MVIERIRGIRKVLGQGILSRAVFSLFLAFLMWGWVTNLDDPEVERTFTNLVPATVGKASDLVILDEGKLSLVTAVVRGPQSALTNIREDDLRATLDLSDIRAPGTHEIEVNVTSRISARGVRVTTNTPERIVVTLDRLSSKTFPLEVDKGTSVPPYNIGNVDYQTRQVEVRGPATLIDHVARVTILVGLGDRRESFEAQFTPEARDASGNRVVGVTIEPGTVTATVAVDRVGRTVSIVPSIQGTLPDGYRVRDTSVSPPSVTVDGPADLLSQLIVVSTTPIDLTERRESFSVYDVPLALPTGVRLLDRTAINVEIRIEAEQQRQQVNVRVTTITDPGVRALLTPTEIVVVLSGSRDRLSQLRSDDVKAELDLRGYTVGTYSLAPRITVPSDLRADPAPTVRVQIDRPTTPTTTPTVTPTPQPTPTSTPLPPPPPHRHPPGAKKHRSPGARHSNGHAQRE